MGESNGAWGELAQHDDELAETWDSFAPLPEPGENPALDAFVERKRITINSLVRIGARLADHTSLAFAGPGYLKFRDVVTDKRWTYAGSIWTHLKLVQSAREPARRVIVVEGETDAAWLTMRLAACDVALMPAGADYFPQSYADQLANYELVLAGLDKDAAGERGAQKILAALPQAVRLEPGGNDWCKTDEDAVAIPMPEDIEPRIEAKVLVSAGELLDLEPPPMISWFEQGVLPVGGQLILHGGWKGFKSFLALDMGSALAQGQDWCCFEPTEEPCRVAVMQYEIPWPYYQQRIRLLRSNAREPEIFDANLLTVTPLRRPQFMAGNKAQEDYLLKSLENEGIQVFVLDPVRRATGAVDLDKEKDVRPLLAFFERLQDAGITVITCHHDNKQYVRSGGGESVGMTRSGAFAGDADTIVSVSLPRGCKIEEPKRNIGFLLRNAPSPASRGMEMGENGHIVYSPEPHGNWQDEGEPGI